MPFLLKASYNQGCLLNDFAFAPLAQGSAMKARLIEMGQTAEQTRRIPVTQAEFLIGRGTDCDLRLPVSSISRHHCIIRLGNEEVTLVDLGSSNGTYLNGQRIRSQADVHHGDEIKLGACRFKVELGDQEPIESDTVVGADPHTTTTKLPPRVGGQKPSGPGPAK
jgi:pSer/pThr/pTyr-binding forkhead associated (FHA) protein